MKLSQLIVERRALTFSVNKRLVNNSINDVKCGRLEMNDLAHLIQVLLDEERRIKKLEG